MTVGLSQSQSQEESPVTKPKILATPSPRQQLRSDSWRIERAIRGFEVVDGVVLKRLHHVVGSHKEGTLITQNLSPFLPGGDVVSVRERCERCPGALMPRRASQRQTVNVLIVATRTV